MEIFTILTMGFGGLIMTYIVCSMLFFGRENSMFTRCSEKDIEDLSDEEFLNFMDDYLENGADKLHNLQKRRPHLKVSESVLAVFILISRYIAK